MVWTDVVGRRMRHVVVSGAVLLAWGWSVVEAARAEGGLAETPAVRSAVLAYWRFETDRPGFRADVKGEVADSSGNGNVLRTFSPETAPTYSGEVPFEVVPGTHARNQTSADFSERPGGGQPTRDFFCSAGSLRESVLEQWTIEASVRFADRPDFAGRFQTFVGRDGYNIPRLGADRESPLAAVGFKKRGGSNKLSIEAFDSKGKYVIVESGRVAKPGVWHHVAARSDGRTLSLYVKEDGADEGYVLEGQAGFEGSLFAGGGDWTVGRGCYAFHPAEQFVGQLDEVRISAVALEPGQFLGARAPEVATLPAMPKLGVIERVERGWPKVSEHLVGAHDPTMFLDDDGLWHMFASHGLPHWRSRDLTRWEKLASALPEAADVPAWGREAIAPKPGTWAPDVIKLDGVYHLYYSLSTFGSQRSAIGLLTSPTLDPADARYRWTDRGAVLQSYRGDAYNAIDPALLTDERGTPWMAFGSWNKGIYISELDRRTGLLARAEAKPIQLAGRPGKDAIEAPCLFRHGGWYYLITSWDFCCRGGRSTYKLMMGRSREITGPYVDREGKLLTEGHGSLLLRSHDLTQGPGQCTLVTDKAGDTWMVHHYYDLRRNGAPSVQVRPIYFDESGWLLAGEPLGDGPPAARDPAGQWVMYTDDANPVTLTLRADRSFAASGREGKWRLKGDVLTLEVPGKPSLSLRLAADRESLVGVTARSETVRALRKTVAP